MHLDAQREEIFKLPEKEWISPTASPLCAPTLVVHKEPGPDGVLQYRTVLNNEALNSITVVPEFPLLNIQSVLELLCGASGKGRQVEDGIQIGAGPLRVQGYAFWT